MRVRLKRATRSEIEELAGGDPDWWPGVLARIADGERLGAVVEERGWSWGGLWGWICADERRVEEWEGALKARAQWMAFETSEIADGVEEEKNAIMKAGLRVKARQWMVGKMDRGRWGESSEVKHSGSVGLNLMAVLASLPRAGAVEALPEKVVEALPVAVESVEEI